MKTLLMIDNYDSFTHNLVQMFMNYDLDILVFRNDKITMRRADELQPDYLVISPGPGGPSCAGISMQIIRNCISRIPVLGVCLGMQCLNEVMGGRTELAPVPVHGKKSLVFHEGRGIFSGIPSPFYAARYHSLTVKPVSHRLRITAETGENVVMGLERLDFPVFGVQFHPESFMTEHGAAMIENFLISGTHGTAVFQGRLKNDGRAEAMA